MVRGKIRAHEKRKQKTSLSIKRIRCQFDFDKHILLKDQTSTKKEKETTKKETLGKGTVREKYSLQRQLEPPKNHWI